jgi:hypothetical protein
MELFMIPAIRFPKTVVELNAIPALITIPRKPKIWPFKDLSIGRARMNTKIPTRIRKNEMAPLVMLPLGVVDLIFLKIHAFIIRRIIKISNTAVG